MGTKDSALAEAFGALLRKLRTDAGLTLEGLGERMSPPMHAQAVARYEAGERGPTLAILYRLAVALNVSPCDLLPDTPRRKKRS